MLPVSVVHACPTLWQNLVTEYSKCKLIHSKNKLIAFAVVAKCMMKTRTDHCAAGLRGKGMIYDLTRWQLSKDSEAFLIGETSLLAPSQSSASVAGEIILRSTCKKPGRRPEED